ncbi:Holliday junction resolvase RuvX [Mycetocola reblochoni]|uniref:Putative pre-16S rRNA nuclease n=2 Tax=Mycetocola reblochoni TaxID=331618 RepID=A0A1R4J4K1_9MICO|nr:Holliday junction resolvase RuvX [Mycetocola reblochoni]RLP69503.1 Holliday junction resolvase RuvX [Mycetocola reblochoni]SJN26633.1 Putative Holliday junction resolvase YggF [Mycetocola reblochoni REB411]
MRTGIRLGIDVGTARVGVASSDLHGILATPVETVPRDHDGSDDVARIAAIVAERAALEVVVGEPMALSGRRTASTEDAIGFASRLAAALPVPVRLVDERMSTVSAHQALRSAGRKQKGTRPIIDQAAAVVILQHALDSERGSGRPPGRAVDPGADTEGAE